MESTFSKIEALAGTIKEYLNTRIASAKLQAASRSSGAIANLLAGIFVAMFFLFFTFFISIALGFVLGEWVGKTWVGFLIVAFMYLFFGLIVWKARGKLIRMPIMNAFIQQLFKQDDEED